MEKLIKEFHMLDKECNVYRSLIADNSNRMFTLKNILFIKYSKPVDMS